jgi:cell division transport system permease protein
MSTNDTVVQEPAAVGAEPAGAAAPAFPKPQFQSPIVPQSTISARALVAVVAIMTFLASLTSGAAVMVRSVANDWQSDVAREVTIQIRPAAGRDIEADIARAAMIARTIPGIGEVRPYSRDETARLLEPWLGTGLRLDDLPVPRIIVVRIAPRSRPDLPQLRAALATEVPSASLDDHRGFVAQMRTMARAAILVAASVLALVLIATVLSVTFATRAAMATNRPVIEVLHLIGAKNSFIADHFQRHFLELGLKGGAAGGGGAVIVFLLAEILTGRFQETGDGSQVGALFGIFSIGLWGYVAVIAQVVLIALITATTSRYTVNRTIESLG